MTGELKRRWRKSDVIVDVGTPLDSSAAVLDNTISTPISMPSTHLTGSTATPFEKQRQNKLSNFFSHIVTAIVMLFVGYQLHNYTHPFKRSPQPPPSSSSAIPKVSDPPWWLEDTVDDFFTRLYNTSELPAVRKLTNSQYFTGMCGRYRFHDHQFPSISVIVTLQNEQPGMLSLTVQTLLARTPSTMLKDIIIIDDNGYEKEKEQGNKSSSSSSSSSRLRERSINETELQTLKQIDKDNKIKIIHNQFREGVARSRMKGARLSNADVLVFVDSHVEMLSGTWAQHLLLPIIENPLTVAAQTLDIINDLDWSYGSGSGDLLYGVITDDFWFAYQRGRFSGIEREKPGRRLPYETPFSAGSLFAVRRDTFFYFGGYDEGMYVWGAENTDFALKTWLCGGRVMMVPCSRVGHMYRIHIRDTGRWPPLIPSRLSEQLNLGYPGDYPMKLGIIPDNFTKIISRNNIRVLERWAKTSIARTGYYLHAFGNETLASGWKQFADEMDQCPHAQRQREIIQALGCKNFDWFDTHVYRKLTGVHHPWHPHSLGKKTWV